MADIDIGYLRGWIGKERESVDLITPRLAAELSAVLDESPAASVGQGAPAGIHWCLCPDTVPMSGLGPDGHPARGDFLPPVPLPRRMWAGGQLDYCGDFLVGDTVTRRSRIADVSLKTGRSGALCFVTVLHDYSTGRGTVLRDRHDIVYTNIPENSEHKTTERNSESRESNFPTVHYKKLVDATKTLLIRYSSVTFNPHRIHYDLDYCMDQERYPALVVHGPLQATLLLRMAVHINDGRLPSSFTFRSIGPLYEGNFFSINSTSILQGHEQPESELWISSHENRITMLSKAILNI